jgi:hypothetical protein
MIVSEMSQVIERHIAHYITYFRDHIESVAAHWEDSKEGGLHSRILYVAILDATSRTVFGQEPNRERLVHFVERFCDWPECNRISLSHLHRLVVNKLDPELAPLRALAMERISSWTPAGKIALTRDPLIAEVAAIWPRMDGKATIIDGVQLLRLQHSQLLYTYRNGLIHEFRSVGRHVELWDDSEPYYAYLGEYESESSSTAKHSWELQYTARFFRRLCTAGLSNLETYLSKWGRDPYDSIDWGNYWIRELNA